MKIACTLLFAFLALNLSGQMYLQQPHNSENPYENFRPGQLNSAAPAETEQFGQFVGIWRAYKRTRQQDGTWSPDTVTADWIWYYVLDGHAIQDDYILPPMEVKTDEGQRFFGTNIRIFNTKEKQWEMAWMDRINREVATFTATKEGDSLVMQGVVRGREVRNIFYNIEPHSYDWVQKWTFDKGQTWLPVVEIHCERL